MRWQARLYIAGVFLTAVGMLAAFPAADLERLTLNDWGGLAFLAVLGILLQMAGVGVNVSGKQEAKSSLIFLPLLASGVMFPPLATAFVVIAIQLHSELFLLQRLILWRTIFNVSQYVIAFTLPAWIYHFMPVHWPAGSEINLIGFAILAPCALLLNHVIVAGFVSLRQQMPVRVVLRKTMGPGGANMLLDVLVSPVAILAVLVFSHLPFYMLVLFFFPIIALRYSYLNSNRLSRAIDDLLTVLVKTIEMQDPYTSGHSLRVSTLSRVIAEAMGMSAREVDRVAQAALLHDVGKVDPIFAPLISKAFSLTPEERLVIQTHSEKGAELLSGLTSVPKDIIQAVLHHHEKYDGTGYPAGLKAEDIPLTSRIIMMADSVDAMLSDRPYRAALPVSKVRSELIRCSGTQFDPAIAKVVASGDTLDRAASLAALADTANSKFHHVGAA